MLATLCYAHARRISPRPIKPFTIFLTEDHTIAYPWPISTLLDILPTRSKNSPFDNHTYDFLAPELWTKKLYLPMQLGPTSQKVKPSTPRSKSRTDGRALWPWMCHS